MQERRTKQGRGEEGRDRHRLKEAREPEKAVRGRRRQADPVREDQNARETRENREQTRWEGVGRGSDP